MKLASCTCGHRAASHYWISDGQTRFPPCQVTTCTCGSYRDRTGRAYLWYRHHIDEQFPLPVSERITR